MIAKLRRNYGFFSEMGEDDVVAFLRMCEQVGFEKGQAIFRQGDAADHFYLIVEGEVAISIRDQEIARLGSGHVFGEMALLERTPRTATATAAEPTRLFSISAGVMSAKTPSLAYKVLLGIAQQMSEKLRETNTHIRAS